MSSDAGVAVASSQWTILRASSPNTGGLELASLPLGVATVVGPIRLALGPNGEARLLLPLAAFDDVVGVEAAGALAVTTASFMQDGRALRFLDLTCLASELEQVFGEVVDEIVSRVDAGQRCIDATRTTLNDFRTLLAPAIPNLVDRARVAGLVGELVVLNRLLDLSSSAWRSWRGPLGDRHDFRVGDASLEVKASLRADATSITINGLEQLAPPSGGRLNLVHMALEPVSGGLLTVRRLGERALAMADDPGGLRDILVKVGCPSVDADAWNSDAFRIESEAVYRVEAGFPRIVPSVFDSGRAPDGVDDVTYRINLDAASGNRCTIGEIDQIFRSFAQ